jgi:hypothetical protein
MACCISVIPVGCGLEYRYDSPSVSRIICGQQQEPQHATDNITHLGIDPSDLPKIRNNMASCTCS